MSAVTTDISSPASVNVSVNIENLDIIGTTTCDLHIEFSLNGEVVNNTVKSMAGGIYITPEILKEFQELIGTENAKVEEVE